MIGISWQTVFWLYAILLPIALLIFLFVPEVTSEVPDHFLNKNLKLPKRQWFLIGLTFITYLLIWGVQLKLPSYFENRNFGDAKTLNFTLAAMNVGGFLAGLTFSHVHRFLREFTLTLGYIGACIAVFLLWFTSNSNIAIVSAVFFNFIYSYTGPYLVLTSNIGLKESQVNILSSFLTIATIISAFFAPLVWNTLGTIGPQTLTDNVLLWIALVLLILTLQTLFFKTRKEKNYESK